VNELAHYSPEELTVLIAGSIFITDFVDGTFISIEKDSPVYSTHESSDGIVSRVFHPSTTHTVTLTLTNSSPSNDVLSVLSQVDSLTQTGKFPMLIKDHMGSSVLYAESCWIQGIPSASYSTGISDRQWVIKCSKVSNFVGGNKNPSPLIESLLFATANAQITTPSLI